MGQKHFLSYLLEPRFQNIVPSINDAPRVNRNLVAMYDGLRQYDKCCFHKQAKNWLKEGWEYLVWKWISLEAGGGSFSSLIISLFLLKHETGDDVSKYSWKWLWTQNDDNSYPTNL